MDQYANAEVETCYIIRWEEINFLLLQFHAKSTRGNVDSNLIIVGLSEI